MAEATQGKVQQKTNYREIGKGETAGQEPTSVFSNLDGFVNPTCSKKGW